MWRSSVFGGLVLLCTISPASCQSGMPSTTSSSAGPVDTNNPSIVANKANITCPNGDGIHMIVTRGSLEDQGEGMTGTLARNISARIPGSTSQGLVYPAVLFPYFDSEAAGVGNLTQLLIDFSAACPTAKYALLGWSQGGQVILDTLCGNSEIGFTNSPPIAPRYTENLIAAVTYGDPSFKAGLSYDRGNATRDGLFNRTNESSCSPYASKIHSYCDQDDTYCTNYNASGLAIHFGYFNKYNADAMQFVLDQYANATGPSSSGSSSISSMPTGASASATNTEMPIGTSSMSAGMGTSSATGAPLSAPMPTSPTAPMPTSTGGAWRSYSPNVVVLVISSFLTVSYFVI